MSALVLQYGVYGLALFTPGVALAARLSGMQAPGAKSALWALAWFAILHGAFAWLVLATRLAPGLLDPAVRLSLGLISFVPLLYFSLFGFGWRAEHIHRVTMLAGVVWVYMLARTHGDPRGLEAVLRWVFAGPIVTLAAAAMLAGRELQGLSRADPLARNALTAALACYAFTQAFSSAAALPAATWFTADTFEALFGVSPNWIKAACAIVALAAVIRMLNALSESMLGSLRARAAASEAQFRATLEIDPECIKVLDPQGNLLDMNAAGLKTIGAASLDEVRGASVFSLIRPEHHDAYRDALASTLRGETSSVQFEIVGLNGVRRWMRQHAAPIRECSGSTVQRIVAVTHDVTAHVTMQDLLKGSKAAEPRLESNASMASFLLHMSHEFRTPLNAIVGYGELLREVARDEGRASEAEDLERVLEAAQTLQRLVSGLLDLTRIEAARMHAARRDDAA